MPTNTNRKFVQHVLNNQCSTVTTDPFGLQRHRLQQKYIYTVIRLRGVCRHQSSWTCFTFA